MATYYFETGDEFEQLRGPDDVLIFSLGAYEPPGILVVSMDGLHQAPQDMLKRMTPPERLKQAGDDTICAGPRGYDWQAANQPARAPRRTRITTRHR